MVTIGRLLVEREINRVLNVLKFGCSAFSFDVGIDVVVVVLMREVAK